MKMEMLAQMAMVDEDGDDYKYGNHWWSWRDRDGRWCSGWLDEDERDGGDAVVVVMAAAVEDLYVFKVTSQKSLSNLPSRELTVTLFITFFKFCQIEQKSFISIIEWRSLWMQKERQQISSFSSLVARATFVKQGEQ